MSSRRVDPVLVFLWGAAFGAGLMGLVSLLWRELAGGGMP
jgi:hypothetical protein